MMKNLKTPLWVAVVLAALASAVWAWRRTSPQLRSAESEAFFDTLEMAGEKALEGRPWPGRRFGVGRVCRPPGQPDKSTLDRSRIAPFLVGSGIEVGALHSKFPVSASAQVRYVDSRSLEELRAHYSELAAASLVAPDIIDEAETLSSVADGSQDFVIASHVLEHTDRVLLSIENQMRVLRRGGIAVIIVPMRCATFDHLRGVTSWEHLLDEYRRPAALAENREEHFREWAVSSALRAVPAAPFAEYVQSTMTSNGGKGYSIHFHVWDAESLSSMINQALHVIGFSYRIKVFDARGFEALVILEKL